MKRLFCLKAKNGLGRFPPSALLHYKFPDRLVGGSDSAFVSSSTEAELKFNRNPAIDVAADCLAAPRRNFEADSTAPWQRALPLDHVEVAAVRATWHDRRCGHHAAETPLQACTAVRERK